MELALERHLRQVSLHSSVHPDASPGEKRDVYALGLNTEAEELENRTWQKQKL